MYMLFNIFNKKKKKGKKEENLCSFNLEEIEEFNKQGKEKINKLNNNILSKEDNTLPIENNKKDNENIENNEEIDIILTKSSTTNTDKMSTENNSFQKNSDIIDDEIIDEGVDKIIPIVELKPKFSYINLPKDKQQIIMNNWQKIDSIELNKDIEKGEDLINHNYTISYCDDAYNFITEIRKKYDVVIKYLIGFNNEKHGILDKTTFGDKDIDEWRYLSNYIKLLEKIKKLK